MNDKLNLMSHLLQWILIHHTLDVLAYTVPTQISTVIKNPFLPTSPPLVLLPPQRIFKTYRRYRHWSSSIPSEIPEILSNEVW